MKRAAVDKLLTRLARELRESGKVTRSRIRILNLLGLRAEESTKRRWRWQQCWQQRRGYVTVSSLVLCARSTDVARAGTT
jgi:hypothetical protein